MEETGRHAIAIIGFTTLTIICSVVIGAAFGVAVVLIWFANTRADGLAAFEIATLSAGLFSALAVGTLLRERFATEAAKACMDYAFANAGIDHVISLIRPENAPSRRVAERNGLHLTRQVMWRDLLHDIWRKDRQG